MSSRQFLRISQEKGRIEDVARKKAENATPYASVRIDGEQYTCWEDALISKLESGQEVDYQREQSGKFKKIIDIEPALDNSHLSSKDLCVVRMSALRSASYLEIGLDLPHRGETPYGVGDTTGLRRTRLVARSVCVVRLLSIGRRPVLYGGERSPQAAGTGDCGTHAQARTARLASLFCPRCIPTWGTRERTASSQLRLVLPASQFESPRFQCRHGSSRSRLQCDQTRVARAFTVRPSRPIGTFQAPKGMPSGAMPVVALTLPPGSKEVRMGVASQKC